MNGLPHCLFCDDASEGAAYGLLALMAGISEEFWCASWLCDLEFDLWEATAGKNYGQGTITERQATLLRLLSEECDGWWHLDTGHEPKFIRRPAWAEKVALRQSPSLQAGRA